MRFYTVDMTFIDKVIHKFRNKLLLVYTGIVLAGVGYVFYLIDTLPEVPDGTNKQAKRTKQPKQTKPNQSEEPNIKQTQT